MLAQRVPTFDARKVKPPPKTAKAIYHTPEYREWQEQVIARAGGRCERVTDGKRCWKRAPQHRMFADHVKELADGGSPFDVSNGMCLCGSHHTAKTAAARAERLATPD